jgi:hypothetical protein
LSPLEGHCFSKIFRVFQNPHVIYVTTRVNSCTNRLTVTGHRPCKKQATSMTKYLSITIAF